MLATLCQHIVNVMFAEKHIICYLRSYQSLRQQWADISYFLDIYQIHSYTLSTTIIIFSLFLSADQSTVVGKEMNVITTSLPGRSGVTIVNPTEICHVWLRKT